MKPARYDFVIPRGDDWAKTFTFPFDLTGWTAELVLGSTVTLKPGSGMVISGSVIEVTRDETQTMVAANYHVDPYRLKLTSPSGVTETYIKGEAEWRTQ